MGQGQGPETQIGCCVGNGTQYVLDRMNGLVYPDLTHGLLFLLLLDASAMHAHLMGISHFGYDYLLALDLDGLQYGVQILLNLATLHLKRK